MNQRDFLATENINGNTHNAESVPKNKSRRPKFFPQKSYSDREDDDRKLDLKDESQELD